MTRAAYKFETEIQAGKVELKVPLPNGTKVEILVIAPETGEFADLVDAAGTSLDFWDNPVDDAEWNNA